ncbi:hypothetical protein OEZ85_005750 [Tetradesmus obliquus]|uniref:Uncharacterized protein n=1 Tax=Tetradesmus obliquus TaxID=3088 RepID=A0ABY8UHP9_TETOB|nr:hypothetical protein OEZ85_005750 [Tetradesmus obliquus]
MVPGFNTAGVRMSRFVVSAWSISNFSSPEMLNADMVQRVHGMVAAYLNVSVDQVYMNASANVTVGYVFSGITPRDDLKWVPKHLDFFDQTMTGVMRGVGSDMAGGYDKSRIQVIFEAPYYGMKPDRWANSSQPPIVQRDLTAAARNSSSSSSNSSNSTKAGKARRLLHLQAVGLDPRIAAAAAAAAAAATAAPDGTLSSRRLSQQQQNVTAQQQQQQQQQDTPGQTPSQTLAGLGFPGVGGLTPVWVIYTQLDPLNVTTLLASLTQACGGVAWASGADVAGQPCGVATRKALRRAGMRVDDAKYQQMIVGKPVVSLDIQLAVGVTDSQQAAGTDQALAAWLAQPGGLISAVSSSPELAFGSDLLIKWLKTPEIWTNLPHKAANKPQTAAWGPNSIAGLAIGMAAAFGLAVGVAVFLLLRWHKGRHAAAAAEPHKADSASDTSSQRNRRRKQGKRRYLLPDPPVPSVAQASAPSDAEAAAETAILPAHGDPWCGVTQVKPHPFTLRQRGRLQ